MRKLLGFVVLTLIVGAAGAARAQSCHKCSWSLAYNCYVCQTNCGACVYDACIVDNPCAIAPNTWETCLNSGSCPMTPPLIEAETASFKRITFDRALIQDVAQVHPRVAEMLLFLNRKGGMPTPMVTVNSTDRSGNTPRPTEYLFTVRMDGDVPIGVELEALVPFADDPPMNKLLFKMPVKDVAEGAPTVVAWEHI